VDCVISGVVLIKSQDLVKTHATILTAMSAAERPARPALVPLSWTFTSSQLDTYFGRKCI
jgi:hypothetical protein